MRILEISLKNLCSLGEVTLSYDKNPLNGVGLIGILGETGSGKSTILDAITLALYNKVARDAKPDQMLSHGTGSSMAQVVFEQGGHKYMSKWSQHRAGNNPEGNLQAVQMELSRWNSESSGYQIIAEKIKEVTKQVTEITGLDEQRFLKSVMLAQGDFDKFLKADSNERSALLEKITDTNIYSELSTATYIRHSEENNKLDLLNRKLALLQIWGEDELRSVKQVLEATEFDSVQRQSELQKQNSLVQAAEEKEKLDLQLAALQLEKESLDLDVQEAIPQLTALENHEKTTHLHADWLQLRHYQTEQESLLRQETSLAQQVEVTMQKLPETSAQCTALQLQLQSKTEYLQSRQPVWDKVYQLDHQLTDKKNAGQKQRTINDAAVAALQAAEKVVQEKQQTVDSLGQDLQQASEWQAAQTQWVNLPDKFPDLKQRGAKCQVAQQNLQNLQTEIVLLEQALQSQEELLVEKEGEAKQLLAEIQPLENLLRDHLQHAFPEHTNAQVDLFFSQLQKLQAQRDEGQQWLHTLEAFNRLTLEKKQWETSLGVLQNQQTDSRRALEKAMQHRQEAEADYTYKEQIYEQQQQIANYALDRANLAAGDPCPLCYATEHPFREAHIEPFVDKAREARDAARLRLEILQMECAQGQGALQSLEVQIQLLQNNAAFSAKLLETEARLGKLPKLDFIPGWDGTDIQVLSQALKQILAQIDALATLQQTCTSLKTQIQVLETTYQAVQQSLAKLERDRAAKKGEWAARNQAIAIANQQYQEQVAQLSDALAPFVTVSNVEAIPAALDSLGKRVDDLLANQAKMTHLNQRLEIERPQLALAKTQLLEKQHVAAVQEEELNRLLADFQQLTNQRQSLFGNRAPADEKQNLEKGIQEVSESLELAKGERAKMELDIENNKGALHTVQENLGKLSQTLAQATQRLHQACLALGLSDMAALEGLILPPKVALAYQQKKQVLSNRETAYRTSQKHTAEALARIEADFPQLPDKDLLYEERNALQQQQNEALQTIGQLKNQLDEQNRLQQDARDLSSAIIMQKHEVKRWKDLETLIGSANGNKFRQFAQGLTLETLIVRANRHLERLYGRYLIRRDQEAVLELCVVDLYMANHTRSMGTLSGGERFLVSLALALGLSEMASKEVQIQSMFIDEGFGSLDENTLDIAFTALENLQAEGRTLSVISHVGELKERLSTKVLVEKGLNGRSTVRLVDR